MNAQLVSAFGVLALLVGIVVVISRLSGRDTRDALDGRARPRRAGTVRYGLFYVDADDPRVWVPRPQGNGWDANLATTGGKALLAGTLVVPLVVIVALTLLTA